MQATRDALQAERRPFRAATLARVGVDVDLEAAIDRLDAMRGLYRTADHAWRITEHLPDVLSGAARE